MCDLPRPVQLLAGFLGRCSGNATALQHALNACSGRHIAHRAFHLPPRVGALRELGAAHSRQFVDHAADLVCTPPTSDTSHTSGTASGGAQASLRPRDPKRVLPHLSE